MYPIPAFVSFRMQEEKFAGQQPQGGKLASAQGNALGKLARLRHRLVRPFRACGVISIPAQGVALVWSGTHLRCLAADTVGWCGTHLRCLAQPEWQMQRMRFNRSQSTCACRRRRQQGSLRVGEAITVAF